MSISGGNVSGTDSEIVQPPPIARMLFDKRLKIAFDTDSYGHLILTFRSRDALVALAVEAQALLSDWDREYPA